VVARGLNPWRAAFKLPDHFLSYELEWPSTPFGIAVCVRWEKPVRQES
jgi:hypothetical protein